MLEPVDKLICFAVAGPKRPRHLLLLPQHHPGIHGGGFQSLTGYYGSGKLSHSWLHSHWAVPGWDHSGPSFVLQDHQIDHSLHMGRGHTSAPFLAAPDQDQQHASSPGGNPCFPGAHGSGKE